MKVIIIFFRHFWIPDTPIAIELYKLGIIGLYRKIIRSQHSGLVTDKHQGKLSLTLYTATHLHLTYKTHFHLNNLIFNFPRIKLHFDCKFPL